MCVSGAHQEDQQEEEDEDEDEGSVQLQMEEVTLRTLDLREYEINPSKKKRRKRKERNAEVTEKEEKLMGREGKIVLKKSKMFLEIVSCCFYLCLHVDRELKYEAGNEKEAEEKMKDKKNLNSNEYDDEGTVHQRHAFIKNYS